MTRTGTDSPSTTSESADPAGRSHSWRSIFLVAAGLSLVLLMARVAWMSPRFEYGSPMLERPIVEFVVTMMAAGLVYVAAVAMARRAHRTLPVFAAMLMIGIGMRGVMFFSDPILEDDFYRYLWDGAVIAHGNNPYAYAPVSVMDPDNAGAIPAELVSLAGRSGWVVQRINHPALGTSYPPVAQLAFAAAHAAGPFSPTALRVVYLGFDLAAVGLAVLILRALGMPLHMTLVYWWNPLLVKETYNSMHMDILLAPILIAAVWFAMRNQVFRAALALVAAIATKLWPILLAPVFLRAVNVAPRRVALAGAISCGALVAILLPMTASIDLGSRAGIVAYGEGWEMNDALFMVIHKPAQWVEDQFDIEEPIVTADRAARGIALLLVLAWAFFLARKPVEGGADLCNRLALAAGGLFLLSPTQFPWYFLWILPFLTFAPRYSLLALTVMLPMYYLKFYYDAMGNVEVFHEQVVWLEYAPVFVLLIWEFIRGRGILMPNRRVSCA